jgi:geranylgeranyl diphosphate synthase type II
LTANYPENTLALIEKGLSECFPRKRRPEVIYEAMRYSLFSGGKRFRAVLLVETASSLGCEPSYVLPAACAIEFVHTYSLIHDDLPALDNDSLRRGVATNHIEFGEDIAILAGDGLLTEAFYLLSAKQETDDPDRLVSAIRELASAVGVNGMIGGQVVDLQSEGKDIDRETLAFIHRNKTGELIKASVRIGAILAGANDIQLKTMTAYASCIGLAFQIVDDVLDVVGDTEKLGKTAGSDERKKKATFPNQYGLETAKEMAREQVAEAKAVLENIEIGGEKSVEKSVLAGLADFVIDREF